MRLFYASFAPLNLADGSQYMRFEGSRSKDMREVQDMLRNAVQAQVLKARADDRESAKTGDDPGGIYDSLCAIEA